jgi:uncharacterized iron-regulated protein
LSAPAFAKLRQLQHALYEKAYKEAHSIGTGASRDILAYSEMFERSLPQRFKRSTLAEMHRALRANRFVLYGDFHTLRQSQRGLLRLLRSYIERHRSNRFVIACEMFRAVDQPAIDAYVAGAITEAELLRRTNYEEDWGFPWPNFKMIVDYAKANGLPVIGVNSENAGRDPLAQRDKFAADRLAEAARRWPDHKIVCLIGEYHLADSHLPRALRTSLKRLDLRGGILRILNNVDDYFFELQKAPSHNSTEYLRLRRGFFCIMNTPPWMKWHSFSMWEEMRHIATPAFEGDHDGDIDAELDLLPEDAFDIDYQFLSFARNLATFLALRVDESDLESFHVHYEPNGRFYEDLVQDVLVEPSDAERMIERVSLDGVYFLPKTKTVLLTAVSINNLAEAAGQFLHTLMAGFDDSMGDPFGDFYRRVVKSAVGMIASKILNPRRKCMELHDFRRFVRRNKGHRLTGQASERRETAHGVLEFDRWITARLEDTYPLYAPPPKAVVLRDRGSNYGISRAIGQMLGYAIYKKVMANKQPTARLRRLFRKKSQAPEAVWREVGDLYLQMTK